MKSVKRIRSKAKRQSEAKTKRLKRVRGSLKGTRAMEVFVSERKRERKLARSTARKISSGKHPSSLARRSLVLRRLIFD
jgi:hypothetical protein